MVTRAMIVMLGLAACGGPNGDHEPDAGTPTDARADAAVDAAVDAPPVPSDVTGSWHVRHITADGTTVTPVDLSGLEVVAFVPDGQGGMTTIAGTGAADGTFRIPLVPPGEYLLRVGVVTRWLREHALDELANDLGRADAAWPTHTTPVTLSLTGLLPWVGGDDLQLFSAGAGFTTFGTAQATGGGTTISASRNWRAMGARLPDASRGDTVTALQVHVAGGHPFGEVFTAQAAATFTTVTITDGTGGTIAGALSPIVQDQHATIDWRRGDFNGFPAEHGEGATFLSDGLYIDTLPASGTYGQYEGSPDLAIVLPDANAPTADWNGAVAYGNPFPPAWGQFAIAESTFLVPLPNGRSVPAYSRSEVDLATLEASGIGPVIAPVRNVRLDGRPLEAGMTGVGLNPVVTWDPPTTGTATRYWVVIGGYDADTYWYPRYGIVTAQPRLQLPPAALEAGTHAFLIISAVHDGDPYPVGSAQLVTASFDP